MSLNYPGFGARILRREGGSHADEVDTETRAKAVRLVTEHSEDYACEYEAIKTVAGRLGTNP